MAPTPFVLILLVALVGGLVGFMLGQKRKRGETEISPPVDESEDSDEPTAPITPLVEMARSPHDRHRDLTIGNALVKSIDLIETVVGSGERQTREGILGQLGILKGDFEGLLGSCSFRSFSFAPDTLVDGEVRTRIQIVAGRAGEGPTRIARTLRCGHLYEPGGEEAAIIIRKAEVEIR